MPATGAVWDPVMADALGTRPGAYINFESVDVPVPVVGAFGTALLIGPADFGPVNDDVEIRNFADADKYLGSTASGVRTTVRQMLRQGVAKVLFYRVAVGAVKATRVLNDTQGVPAAALTINAKYPGTFGNSISVEVVTNVDGVNKNLNVYVSGVLKESFIAADNDGLVADWVAKGSNLVEVVLAGTADRIPANVASTPLAGGASGSAVTSAEYTAALAAVAALPFRTIALYTSDTAIQVSTKTWAADQRASGKRVVYFAGSAAALAFASRAAQAVALNKESTVYVGSDYTTDGKDALAGYQAAAVVAAMHARYGVQSLTAKPVVGAASVDTGFTDAQYEEGLRKGLIILSDTGDEVVIEQGLNTLQAASQVAPKSRDWRKIRFVAILDTIAIRITAKLLADYVGDVENDERGRGEAVRMTQQVLNQAAQERLILTGIDENSVDRTPRAFLDPRYVSGRDAVYVAGSFTPIDAAEKFFFAFQV